MQWDNRSLVVQGRRTFVWSGEFHFWRLPVPDLWRDILQKMKAAGFNTVRIFNVFFSGDMLGQVSV